MLKGFVPLKDRHTLQ